MPVEYVIILILALGGFTFSFAGFGFALITLRCQKRLLAEIPYRVQGKGALKYPKDIIVG